MNRQRTTHRAILLVDDTDTYREQLVAQLQDETTEVVGVSSAMEAVRLFGQNPQRFQFAVIDQVLDADTRGGIELTRNLVNLNRELFVAVFTNTPSNTLETETRFAYEALSAGAFRYLRRDSPRAAKIQAKTFLKEMEQLSALQQWIAKYYADRQNVPSLLTQLDIGVDIIDRSHKLWFMNDAMRRITGISAPGLPKSPCSHWHGFAFCPCFGCLVECSFEERKARERVVLLPFPFRRKDKLFFMRIWAQPITDDQGNVICADDMKPLAVMESVQDLTDSAQLRAMPFSERLAIIANALYDRPLDGRYAPKRVFEGVRIMVRDRTRDNFTLEAAAGCYAGQPLGSLVILSEVFLDVAEQNMRQTSYGYFFESTWTDTHHPAMTPAQQFIYWPVMEGGRTIALIEASGSGCNRDTVGLIRPYAAEVLNALLDSQKAGGGIKAQVESEIGTIDLELQHVGTPFDALKLLVRRGIRLTDSCGGHIRYVDGNEAVLLRLDDIAVGTYEAVAPPIRHLSYTASWSVRTILSAREHIVDMVQTREELNANEKGLSEEVRNALKRIKSICLQPLILQGQCIGSLSFEALTPKHFNNSKRCEMVREIAHRIAFVLHDYLVEKRTSERVKQAQTETFALILHNISTPTATMRFALGNLLERLRALGFSDPDSSKRLAVIQKQIDIISGVRTQFLNLQKPFESRMEPVSVPDCLQDRAHWLQQSQADLQTTVSVEPKLINVKTDKTAIDLVLVVLLQNAADAMQEQQGKKNVLIRVREMAREERRYAHFVGPGLAIDVEDNGPGVPSEMVGSLFEIIKSGKAKGLGFGLKSCRRVAQSAHGDVYYHPEFRRGAKFSLVLPYEPL